MTTKMADTDWSVALEVLRACYRVEAIRAATTGCSSKHCTVEVGFFGPVDTSATEVRFFHFATVFRSMP